ncbi:hypothetical protein EO087_15575 [Dyella sp. M7H15-1]|uniref:YadA-like family protein n=1 Tax=Dyella sp. M7H15-1 TaxID=2501295 RepID=UPI0010051CDB|nr:YadA-like family protein [Dyella sp. M7H15-1]QAU25234.1 hypothetical protein EO087_15575 [Dyella sp. M7H15-1]
MMKTIQSKLDVDSSLGTACGQIRGGRKATERLRVLAIATLMMGGGTSGALSATESCTIADGKEGVADVSGFCAAAGADTEGKANKRSADSVSITALLPTDPVNLGQLTSLVTALGGGATINTTTGAVTGPTYTLANGGKQVTVGGALVALDDALTSANTQLASKLDGVYLKINGTTASTATGSNAIAMGDGALSNSSGTGEGNIAIGASAKFNNSGDGAIVLGRNATVQGPIGNLSVTGAGSMALGDGANVYGNQALAIGAGASVAHSGNIAIGSGASSAGVDSSMALGANASSLQNYAVALGSSTVADRQYTVSVGSAATDGTGFTRQIVNVRAGTQANDAVNLSQLSPIVATLGGGASVDATTGVVTGPTYTLANGGKQTSIGGALSAIDGALSATNTNVTGLGGRVTINENSMNALNIDVTNLDSRVAVNEGNLVTLNADLTNLDGRVTVNEGDIALLQQQLGDGSVGLVQQDIATGRITVAASNHGGAVDFTGADGARTLTGIAAGEISDSSVDAVNGSQLSATAQQVQKNSTDIDAVNTSVNSLDGRVTASENNIHTLNTSVTNLDGRVTTNEGSITWLQQQVNSGSIGLVQQDASTGNVTLAAASGGPSINVAGTDGLRVLTGVANGANDSDVVTLSQLKSVGLVDPSGQSIAALVYDDMRQATATLGGDSGTLIRQLAAGDVAAGSMDAINGSQLFETQQQVQSQFDSLNGQFSDISTQVANLNQRVGGIEQGSADGNVGDPAAGGVSSGSGSNSLVAGNNANASGSNSTAVGNDASAAGDNSTAIGNAALAAGSNSTANGSNAQAIGDNSTAHGANAVASGNGSIAVGEGALASGETSTALGASANASGNNAVALGAGSVADRDNTVSVGSVGNERQVTNVAAGTERTDAANWGQVQDAVSGVQDWANQRFNQLDRRVNRIGAMSAAYGQMAFSAQGLQTANKVGVGVGAQGGQSAIAVGYSRQLKPNLNVSFGGSATGSDVSVGAGMSLGW